VDNQNKAESIISKKAYAFALEIVKLYKLVAEQKREYVLSKQLLRAGTSVGANILTKLFQPNRKEILFIS